MERSPVLAGVGAEVRRGDELPGLDHLGLMEVAARQALDDAGIDPRRVGAVLVPRGLWRDRDPGRVIADRLGAHDARTTMAELGVPQLSIVRRACQLVADGTADVVLVVGGEAKHRQNVARRAGAERAATEESSSDPDETMRPDADLMARPEVERRLNSAPPQYAVIETAIRAAAGRTPAAHQAHLGRLWADFARIAASNPDAWDQSAPTAEQIANPGAGNRVVAWPYTKLLCSQWNVDQSAAMVFTHGVDGVHPRGIAESNLILSMSLRRDLHRWPAFSLAAEKLLDMTGIGVGDIGPIDFYSCFPAAVQTAALELGVGLDRDLTVTGGMTFGGGPLNNYVFQAIVTMARRLRDEPGAIGLTTAVSGLLTKPALALWSTEPGDRPFQHADVTADARRATAQCPLDGDATGEGTVAGYTVLFDGDGPSAAVAVVDIDGTRTVAICDDAATAARMKDEEHVGASVKVTGAGVFTA